MISAPSMMILMQRLIGSWYPLMGADCKQLCRERIKRKKKKSWRCRDLYLAGTMRPRQGFSGE